MKKYRIVFTICLLVVLTSSFVSFSSKREAVAFPDGYRQWNHIKTYLIGPNHAAWPKYGGFNHTYANDKALEGYRTNNWPDGAAIVVDVREAAENKGDYAWGKVKFIDVMVKDSKKYASTGGWGFEEFLVADKTKPALNDEGKNKCFSCHQDRSAGQDLVLGTFKEQ